MIGTDRPGAMRTITGAELAAAYAEQERRDAVRREQLAAQGPCELVCDRHCEHHDHRVRACCWCHQEPEGGR